MNKTPLISITLIALFCVLSVSVAMAQTNGDIQLFSVEWSKNGSRFAIVTGDSLTVYDSSFNVVVFQEFPDILGFEIPDIALSPNGDRLYVGRGYVDPGLVDIALPAYCDSNWTAVVCEQHVIVGTDNLELLVNLGTIPVSSSAAEWSSDSVSIAFRSGDERSINVYSAVDGTLLRSISTPRDGHEGSLEWSPNDLYFALAGRDTVYVLDATTGEFSVQYQFTGEALLSVNWSPDSTRLAVLSTADVATGTLGSYPDSNSVNGARRDSIIVFEIATEQVAVNIHQPIVSPIALVAWGPDGNQIAVEGNWSRTYIWDSNTGNLLDSFQLTHPYIVRNFSYSPYGGRLMIGLRSGNLTSDPNFVPLSSFGQLELNGLIQFVSPNASQAHLSAILANCGNDAGAVATGTALINGQQYNEFMDWVDQQPETAIPTVCADDLQFMALAILNE